MAIEVIEVTADDKRVGKLDSKGAIVTWPKTDVFGGVYVHEERVNFVRRYVEGGKGLFVLIPPNQETPDLRVTVAGALRAAMVEPPVEDAPPDGTPGKRSK